MRCGGSAVPGARIAHPQDVCAERKPEKTMQETTIAAIATAPGAGGIAVVRLSGAESYQVAARVFHPANPAKKVEEAKGYTALFGHFVDREEAFDEGVALFLSLIHI